MPLKECSIEEHLQSYNDAAIAKEFSKLYQLGLHRFNKIFTILNKQLLKGVTVLYKTL
jgi:hypothetical protein